MMRAIVIGLTSALLFLSSGMLYSETSGKTDTAVVVVDMQAVIQALPQFASTKQSVQKQFEDVQKKLQAEQKTLEDNLNRLKRDETIMQEADKKKLQDQIESERTELLKDTQESQAKALQAQNDAMNKLVDAARKAVEGVAKKKGAKLAIDKGAAMYFDSSLDITQATIEAAKH